MWSALLCKCLNTWPGMFNHNKISYSICLAYYYFEGMGLNESVLSVPTTTSSLAEPNPTMAVAVVSDPPKISLVPPAPIQLPSQAPTSRYSLDSTFELVEMKYKVCS